MNNWEWPVNPDEVESESNSKTILTWAKEKYGGLL